MRTRYHVAGSGEAHDLVDIAANDDSSHHSNTYFDIFSEFSTCMVIKSMYIKISAHGRSNENEIQLTIKTDL